MHYKLYILTEDGHVRRRLDLACEDDAAGAERKAVELLDGSAVELWERDRFIAHFPAGARVDEIDQEAL